MKMLNLKIIAIKTLTILVMLIGAIMVYTIGKPMVINVYTVVTRDTHLVGEVYTAKDLNFTIQPERIFYDKWDISSGYDGQFIKDGYTFKHGIGWYIPSKNLKQNKIGTTKMGIWLGKEFEEIYFHLCTDSEWGSSSNAGEYRIICYVDGVQVKDTDFQNYTYEEEIKLDVSGANDIVIELQERKGKDGTLNVILGEFEASKNIVSEVK